MMGACHDILEQLRNFGWSVAVHNDYRLDGKPHTFWLFTRGQFCAKGEGATDEEALCQVADQISRDPWHRQTDLLRTAEADKSRLGAENRRLRVALAGLLAEWDKFSRYGSPIAKAGNAAVNYAREVAGASVEIQLPHGPVEGGPSAWS